MNKIDRRKIDKPQCLIENSIDWTNDWLIRLNKKKDFNWHYYKKESVQAILIEILSNLTNFTCTYCGYSPLRQNVGGRSIDHFKPKSMFPELAFEWTNLFVSCTDCQKNKKDIFPENEPIKPDSDDYNFDYWFAIDFKNHLIIPNKFRTINEQERAKITIKWLGLNKGARPLLRADLINYCIKNEIKDFSMQSYQFYLERFFN